MATDKLKEAASKIAEATAEKVQETANTVLFVPRTTVPTAPPNTEKWWSTSWSPCSERIPGTTLPNCVGWAWGRFGEIMNADTPADMGHVRGNGGEIYDNVTSLEKGQEPQLGAMIVWKKAGAAGHVAVVEGINADGTLNTSESGYSWGWEWKEYSGTGGGGIVYFRQGRDPFNYSSYQFVGYVYNPRVAGGYGAAGSAYSLGGGGQLYTSRSTRADASFREVCYADVTGKPSISKTGMRLSAINYTSLLADYVAMYGGGASGSADNIDGLDPVPREIVQYFLDKGLNTAAAIGIIANIKSESNFNTGAIGDHGTSFGICQWHLGRGDAMKAMAGADWANNLTGQLDYLWYELSNSYQSVLSALQAVPNTLEGAKQAADIFVRKFEIPANVDQQSQIRQQNAEEFWSKIVVGAGTSTSSSTGELSGQGVTLPIPSNISQSGILADYTNYNSWGPKWINSSYQEYRDIARQWDSEGRPSKYGIATAKGLYLVALTQEHFKTGDAVSVVLEDGTYFNTIVQDVKGGDKGNQWGHYFGGKLSLVEFEATDGKNLNSHLKQAGWYGKKVAKFVNFGNWKSINIGSSSTTTTKKTTKQDVKDKAKEVSDALKKTKK